MPTQPNTNRLLDHCFCHESGKLIASLVRFFGLKHFELVEDMVQAALVEALHVWKIQGAPDQPSAWIHRVAKNRVLDVLRRDTNFKIKAAQYATLDPRAQQSQLDNLFDESLLEDNQLRLIFACCHPSLPVESAIPLTLKSLCGFSELEIARGMLLESETVRKRIYRTRQLLIEQQLQLDLPSARQLPVRLHYVHNVLYLMFNEGYSSSNGELAIRSDVCEEAARLCHLLTEHPNCSTRTTFALLALMLFHASRFDARIDATGNFVLIENQDREKWDRRMMSRAMEYLNHASGDEATSVYHCEAAIAMYHCRAPAFDQTDWSAIIRLYDRLIESVDSPVYRLNRAIAIGQKDGPEKALALLDPLKADPALGKSPRLETTLGVLCRMKGDLAQAERHFQSALRRNLPTHDRLLIQLRLEQCQE